MIDHSHKVIFSKIIQSIDIKDKKVLEVGCGNGRISALLAEIPCSLIAIDPDVTAINKAKAINTEIDFRVGSGEELSFPDHCFDIIIFTRSLHHQNSRKALDEAARTIRTKGSIIIIEPVIEGEIEQVFAFIHNENKEKKEAQYAIEKSEMILVSSEKFTANWEFKDKHDLVYSVFKYYGMPYDDGIASKVINFIGHKAQAVPLTLLDTMIIQILRPYNHEKS